VRQETEVRTASKYEYDTDKLVKAIRMRYAESESLEFTGLDIDMVTTNNSDLAVKETIIQNFSADLNYINANPSAIGNSGFVIVVAEKSPDMLPDTYRVANAVDPLTNKNVTNGLLSVNYLNQEFYTSGLPFAQAYVNGVLINVQKILKQKKQNQFKLLQCNGNFSAFQLYRTGLGYGKIKEAEHLQDENALRLTLLIL
jgi:hypothetical protein